MGNRYNNESLVRVALNVLLHVRAQVPGLVGHVAVLIQREAKDAWVRE